MSAKRQETQHRGFRYVATGAARLPALYRVRAAITACRKATARHAQLSRAERNAQWRHKPRAKGIAASRLDESRKHLGGCARATGVTLDQANPAGRAEGLQPMGGHAVSARLRPAEGRSGGGFLQLARLDASQHKSSADAYRASAGGVEACAPKQFGMTRHGTNLESSFRHGTKCKPKTRRVGQFVSPRNKTPRFSGLGCPATGHLSKYAICTEYEGWEVRR